LHTLLVLLIYLYRSLARVAPLLVLLRLLHPCETHQIPWYYEGKGAPAGLGELGLEEGLVGVVLLVVVLDIIFGRHFGVDTAHGDHIGFGQLTAGFKQVNKLWAQYHDVHVRDVFKSLRADAEKALHSLAETVKASIE